MSKALPTVTESNLLIWDQAKLRCGGYLQKKASQTSAFSKGKWQRRYFSIDLDLGPRDNYQLEYFHSPEDKTPRAIMALTGATVKISSATAFAINFPDSTSISLNADTSDIMQHWIGTLEHVISVANLRDRMMHQFAVPEEGVHFEQDNDGNNSDNNENFHRLARAPGRSRGNYVKVSGKGWPTVRLDFDAAQIPPTSKERHKFIDQFSRDIAIAVSIDPSMVEVISIKSAPGMDWLCLVEFDLNLALSEATETESASLTDHHSHTKKSLVRKRLLHSLHEMIRDTSSLLYNGGVTSKLDPSFALNFVDRLPSSAQTGATSGSATMMDGIFSESMEVMKVMQRYLDVVIPDDFVTHTHFNITLYFEGRIGLVSVPNPAVLAKRHCALWPFEVKQALGFIGTMQELWIDPVELVPRDTATKAAPIPFSPSVRCGGQLIINAVHLTPDCSYDVKCIDRRDDALNSLSQEEMDSIKETFQQCDLDGDGGISKAEMEEIVRSRTQDRKAAIEQKFQLFIRENEMSREDLEYFDDLKTQYLQQLQEAQVRMLEMFEAADLNSDGSISFTEFILAEAWWLRCTINPDRVHLF